MANIQPILTDKGIQTRKVTVLKNGKRVTEMQPVGPNHTLALVDGQAGQGQRRQRFVLRSVALAGLGVEFVDHWLCSNVVGDLVGYGLIHRYGVPGRRALLTHLGLDAVARFGVPGMSCI